MADPRPVKYIGLIGDTHSGYQVDNAPFELSSECDADDYIDGDNDTAAN